MKKPRTDGPIKIVINKSSGVAHVISNSCVSSEVYRDLGRISEIMFEILYFFLKKGSEQPQQKQQRSVSTESQGPLLLEPQVVLEEGGRAVAQWKRQESSAKEKAKEPSEAEKAEKVAEKVSEPLMTRDGRRLIQVWLIRQGRVVSSRIY